MFSLTHFSIFYSLGAASLLTPQRSEGDLVMAAGGTQTPTVLFPCYRPDTLRTCYLPPQSLSHPLRCNKLHSLSFCYRSTQRPIELALLSQLLETKL